MTAERHLILQEKELPPSMEWPPRSTGWLALRISEGQGYWLQSGLPARSLAAGDVLLLGRNVEGTLRASQLSPLKLHYFTVLPQLLSGVLTLAESHQFEVTPKNPARPIAAFTLADPIGQKFAALAALSADDHLAKRCACLQLWSDAVSGVLATLPVTPVKDDKLRERFRQLVGQIPETELAAHSLAELAGQLHCSERHFSRLFREEFGASLRARQIELRLQHARQLLLNSNAKIINVAYESGYRHLGLFNAMFKKRFGVTPSEWRRQNLQKNFPARPRNNITRLVSWMGVVLLLWSLNLLLPQLARADSATAATNAAPAKPKPHFEVRHYEVEGNTILPPATVGATFTNVPGAFGPAVTFDEISAALTALQRAYHERGYVTVSVTLPQQRLTNATVKVKVIEGSLVDIKVTGNRWYSEANVRRALPSLHTNMFLNNIVFQRELDTANASRDRQIYPVVGPGPEPGTSELTLKVKDQFPLHGRLEVNNDATPNTPDMRVNSSFQYDNLWNLEHQVGVQYSFTLEQFKNNDQFGSTPFDEPLIANYSGYYRIPLGGYTSVQQQVDENPASFGYNRLTHQFNLPPATGRPELTFYGSRSTSDTGVQFGSRSNVVTSPLLTIDSQNTGENIPLNEGLGTKLTLPLSVPDGLSATLSFGLDFKRYRTISYNTNNFYATTYITNTTGGVTTISTNLPTGQPPANSGVDYVPLNVGFAGSLPDKYGQTFFNATANFNVIPVFSNDRAFSRAAYSTNTRADYVTVQMGADRTQNIYKDWTVKFQGDGQWANGPLIGNEQFAMGGTPGVRGYTDGEAYGDTGWRVSVEPQTPLVNIGMVDGDQPCWVRSSIFVDYGETYLVASSLGAQHQEFWGAGWSLTATIGSHWDARLTIACPLLSTVQTPANDVHIYFGIGAQF